MTSSALVTSTAPDSLADRIAEVSRNTAETRISVRVNLDGTGQAKLHTGIGFFDHMLDQIARHGLIDLEIDCAGDLHIDGHHTVEDVGITLGQAFARAVGDKKGIRRYGHAYVPLDEALSRVVVDFSGRPGLHMDVKFTAGSIGQLDTQLIQLGNRSLAQSLQLDTQTLGGIVSAGQIGSMLIRINAICLFGCSQALAQLGKLDGLRLVGRLGLSEMLFQALYLGLFLVKSVLEVLDRLRGVS